MKARSERDDLAHVSFVNMNFQPDTDTSWQDAFRAVKLLPIDNGSISQSSIDSLLKNVCISSTPRTEFSQEKKLSKEGVSYPNLGTT